ncbi:hypothetical protein HPB51_020198 [Rhipicephalus microplus]|uniref:Uncharacterized protein n=1 Tax=Rhipicephalus microplus TaxID=6941 RepID=A0A9J6D730_RHIMP|nr:hypothetical protein HPB51_020198 [Rhipicephalus microplus]
MSCQIQGSKEYLANGFLSELCEAEPDLTSRTWDKFALAIRKQYTSEMAGQDVVIGTSRPMRTAVVRVLQVSTGGVYCLSFGRDVPTPSLPRSPVFDYYHMEEWPPPIRDWHRQPERNRHMARLYDSSGSALFQEHQRSVMRSPTTLLVNLSESGAPPFSSGGGVRPLARNHCADMWSCVARAVRHGQG